jgi:hypothetical protein
MEVGLDRGRVAAAAVLQAGTAQPSRPFQWLVRAGFLARGITYALIGGLALALAFGDRTMGAAPSQQGAFSSITRASVGRLALIVIAVGLLAYALWKLGQAVRGRGLEASGAHDPKDRIANLAGGVVYLDLLDRLGLGARSLVFVLVGYFVLRTAIDFNPRTAVGIDGSLARLHQHPLGPWLVGLVGAGLITFAAFSLLEARYRRL